MKFYLDVYLYWTCSFFFESMFASVVHLLSFFIVLVSFVIEIKQENYSFTCCIRSLLSVVPAFIIILLITFVFFELIFSLNSVKHKSVASNSIFPSRQLEELYQCTKRTQWIRYPFIDMNLGISAVFANRLFCFRAIVFFNRRISLTAHRAYRINFASPLPI